MTIFELWLFTTAIPGLSVCSVIMSLILGAMFIVLSVYGSMQRSMGNVCPEMTSSQKEAATSKASFDLVRKIIIPFILFFLLACVLPSERQMMLIAGGYTVTNNADMKNIPGNTAKAVNAWLNAITDAAADKPETKSKSK